MKNTIIAAVAAISASFGADPLLAQNLRDVQAPDEFPPASYKSTQYVDSKGCVYIRAGIDGNVTWVPRVNRQRQLLCGQTPTQVDAGAPAAAPTAKAPVQLTVEAPAAPEPVVVETKPTPTPRVAEQKAPEPVVTESTSQAKVAAPPSAAPAPTVFTTAKKSEPSPQVAVVSAQPQTASRPKVTARPSPSPAPTVFVTAKAPKTTASTQRGATSRQRVVKAPSPSPAPTVFKSATKTVSSAPKIAAATTRSSVCPNATAVSQRYINTGTGQPVRCGPQPSTVRVMPKHVYENLPRDDVAKVPEGYRPAWDDDRLNPRRAEQSLQGIARTRMIWTDTVPRRLIDQKSGRDVTRTVPLVYPYTDVETQQRDLGEVTIVHRDGQVVKRVVRNSGTARQPTVSTRSTPASNTKPAAQAQPVAAGQGRYVQVGMFGVPTNAQAAGQKLARTGLPTRMATLTRGSKSYKLVLAGPFGTSAETKQALAQARAVGFSDAFVRR